MRYETPEIIRLGNAKDLTRGLLIYGWLDYCGCGCHSHPSDPVDA